MERDKVFDGDVSTFFDSDVQDNAWVGLDYERHAYELFYWDGQNWRSLDRQIASGHHISCSLPNNALLFFRNQTMQKKGHFFTMRDGIQKWIWE